MSGTKTFQVFHQRTLEAFILGLDTIISLGTVIGVRSGGKVAEYINKYGGKGKIVTREIGVFSHAGQDGPTARHRVSNPPLGRGQMAIAGGWAAIDFNWKKRDAMAFFMAVILDT